jgi:hypothetical protein
MHPIESFGLRLTQSKLTQANDPQSGFLNGGYDGADGVLCHGVGLDDGERAFKGHENSWAQH